MPSETTPTNPQTSSVRTTVQYKDGKKYVNGIRPAEPGEFPWIDRLLSRMEKRLASGKMLVTEKDDDPVDGLFATTEPRPKKFGPITGK